MFTISHHDWDIWGQGNSIMVSVSVCKAGHPGSSPVRSACFRKMRFYQHVIVLFLPVLTGSPKAVHVLLCLCDGAWRRSPVICCKSKALCQGCNQLVNKITLRFTATVHHQAECLSVFLRNWFWWIIHYDTSWWTIHYDGAFVSREITWVHQCTVMMRQVHQSLQLVFTWFIRAISHHWMAKGYDILESPLITFALFQHCHLLFLLFLSPSFLFPFPS